MTGASARRPAAEESPRRDVRLDRRCRRCGYGIATARLPATCPMCGSSSWEPVERRFWPELDANRKER